MLKHLGNLKFCGNRVLDVLDSVLIKAGNTSLGAGFCRPGFGEYLWTGTILTQFFITGTNLSLSFWAYTTSPQVKHSHRSSRRLH